VVDLRSIAFSAKRYEKADRNLNASVIFMADMTCIALSAKTLNIKKLTLFESYGVQVIG